MQRRHFITGLPAVWLSAPVVASAEHEADVDELVGKLTKKLAELHGGEWKTTIDGKNRFVMICRH